ncbi:MAG TPA: hypothetical protein PLE74_00035 [Candidatus Cloacimonadota bacterium]|nr:hypothetical protein [Candidatus Cloacimonadota bacterium]HPT70647.1 hypothetical protein [Candidatus Cloacimonadota bacterium]
MNDTNLSSAVYRYLDSIILGNRLNQNELNSLLNFISNRQGKGIHYRNLYEISDDEWYNPIYSYTGEKLTTKASKMHILGEYASFVLHHAKTTDKELIQIRDNTSSEFLDMIIDPKTFTGRFCCKRCTVALWLHLSQLNTPQANQYMKVGLKWLKSERTGTGRWNQFPFFDTVLSLHFMNTAEAREELVYALPALHKAVKTIDNEFDKRKHGIIKLLMN